MNVLKVGSFIRDRRMSEKLSLRKMAGLAGVSIPYLSQVERGLRKPSADILQAIARGLRISAETLYVQAGMLEERPTSDVATAVMADLWITESQKKALVQIYHAFRDETGRAPSAEPAEPVQAESQVSKKSARTTSAGRPARAKATARPRPASGRGSAADRRSRKAGGGTGSKAGSSPHPAPTRSPVTNR